MIFIDLRCCEDLVLVERRMRYLCLLRSIVISYDRLD